MENKDKEKGLFNIEKEVLAEISEPTIKMTTNSGEKEVFKFTKDQLYLYGKKVEVNDPEVIQGFKTWMKEWGYIKK
jgi:hypothetical protein